MKFLTTIITGVIVGGLGVYFTLDWQEEDLHYSITAPAKFGDINYQNIHIFNDGWNPAINIKVYVDHQNIKFNNAQSKTSLKEFSVEKGGLAKIERIRRNEGVIISLAYKGQPLLGNQIKIASNRSIAEHVENEGKYDWLFETNIIFVIVMWVVLTLYTGFFLPIYERYKMSVKKSSIIDKDKQ